MIFRRYICLHDHDPNSATVSNAMTSRVQKVFEGEDNDYKARVYAETLNAVITAVLQEPGVKNAHIEGDRVQIQVHRAPDAPWVDYQSLDDAVAAIPQETYDAIRNEAHKVFPRE